MRNKQDITERTIETETIDNEKIGMIGLGMIKGPSFFLNPFTVFLISLLIFIPFLFLTSPLSASEFPPEGSKIILNVPRIVQTWNNCGPANLCAVLNFWGIKIDQQTIAKNIRPCPNDPHVSLSEVRSQVPGQLRSLIVDTDYQILLEAINRGIPVVLPVWFSDTEGEQMAHYLTITGFSYFSDLPDESDKPDKEDTTFYFMDSLGEYSSLPASHILALNRLMGGKALIIAPYSQIKDFRETISPGTALFKERPVPNNSPAEYPEGLMISRPVFTALSQLDRAITLLKEDKSEESLSLLNSIPRQNLPWRIFWYRGEAFGIWMRAGDYNTMLSEVNKALSPYPWSEELFYWKALALSYNGEEKAAREALKKGQELHPQWFTKERMDLFPEFF